MAEMTNTSPPEARGRRGEIRVAIAHRFATLMRLVGPSRQEAAETEVRSLESLFGEMDNFIAGVEAAPSESCWRCGANLNPPPTDVEREILANERTASWSGWTPDIFRAKMRQSLQLGDRIIQINVGAVAIRKPDGSTLIISKLDA
ncbi:MAG: hypothetical protein ACYDC3_10365 [Candidatus Binataceae bacterium]